MVLLVIAVSGICYGIATVYRYYAKLNRKGLLEPPTDLLESFKKEKPLDDSESELLSNRNRYSKAQARQRFKKGKS